MSKYSEILEQYDSFSLGGFSGYLVTSFDKNYAVDIAEDWLKKQDTEKIKSLSDLIFNIFEIWKFSYGEAPSINSMFGIKSELSEIDRLVKIENRKPWETAPSGYATPLGLFTHLWSTGFKDNVFDKNYYDCLAILIKFSDSLGKKEYWHGMILSSLCLSKVNRIVAAGEIEFYHKKLCEELPQAKAKRKQNANLRQNSLAALQDKNRTEILQSKIHQYADGYLGAGKKKKDIVALITRALYPEVSPESKKFLSKKKTTYRYLELHQSGLWSKKK